VDVDEVSDFNAKYELYDPCSVMFFFQNKAITCDFGVGVQQAINWPLTDCQWTVDCIDAMFKSAKKKQYNVSFSKKSDNKGSSPSIWKGSSLF